MVLRPSVRESGTEGPSDYWPGDTAVRNILSGLCPPDLSPPFLKVEEIGLHERPYNKRCLPLYFLIWLPEGGVRFRITKKNYWYIETQTTMDCCDGGSPGGGCCRGRMDEILLIA